jgi:ketopantoate hydroxymethyltransferase
MVMHGYESTAGAAGADDHARPRRVRGAKRALVVVDMPFGS